MIKIDEEKTIHLTRGDATSDLNILPISIDDYTFEVNDKLTLIVMNKKGYREEPYIKKNFQVASAGATFNLELTHNDTKVFPLSNKKKTYWYDLVLNDTTTIYGFDEENAKKFIVYPGGVIDD